MSKHKDALGKGIRALLTNMDSEVAAKSSLDITQKTGTPNFSGLLSIPLAQIEINPFQPRATFNDDTLVELANSIKIHGVIQPLTVKKSGLNKYQLIAGERRLRASKIAGLKEVPAYVRIANDQESLEIALIENIQREDLNAVEIGINYKRLIDECNLSHDELAQRVGKNRSTVTNFLRLLKLPPDIQIALKANEISMGHARALIAVENADTQLFIFKETIKKGLNVRQVEELVRSMSGSKTANPKKAEEKNIELKKIEDRLASYLSTKVQLHAKANGKGEMVISYFSNSDLERLLDLMLD